MSSTERAVAWFWRRAELSTAPVVEGLGLLRVLAGLFLLCFSAPYLSWVNRAPPAFYNPPLLSLGRLLPGFPPAFVTWTLDAVLLGLCAAVSLGVRARFSTLLLCGLSLLRANVAYSFGKIDHDIMIWVFFGCMAFSGWGRELALVPDRPSRLDAPRHAFAVLGVCLVYAMTSVGFQKALNWLDFDTTTSGFLGWFVYGYFEYNRTHLLAPYVLDVPRVLLELLDYAGVAFELGCLLAFLLGRTTFRLWLSCACAFHLANTLTLNIPFFEHLLVYLAFVDFSAAQRWLAGYWGRPAFKSALASLLGSLPLLHLGLRATGNGSSFLFVVDKRRDQLTLLYASAFCWALALCVTLVEVARQRRRRGAATA
jgi:hypothetical protein